jgi:hypothetical protein
MRYFNFLIYLPFIILITTNLPAQIDYPVFQDSVIVPEGIEPGESIYPINLTGNIRALDIVVGFPDRPHTWPNVPEDLLLRRAGTFPNGTLLSDSLDFLNGQLPVDEWFKKGTEYFFNFYSDGQYTAVVTCPKDTISGLIYAFTTDSTLDYWIQKHIQQFPTLLDTNTIWQYKYEMINQVSKNIYLKNPEIFENAEYVNFTFIGGFSKHQFHKTAYAFAFTHKDLPVSIPGGPSYYFTGSIARGFGALTHEMLHCIGSAVNHPTFTGLPDRGSDVSPFAFPTHHNHTGIFDIMHHTGESLPSQYSLYGTPPMASHDLIFLGWINPEEILTINLQNVNDIKFADIIYPLNLQQKSDNFFRIVKILTSDPKEYFLVEFHQGSEFDRNLMNFDEGPANDGSYNKGLLVWHIKEGNYSLNVRRDHYVDVEVAVPYNGWYGSPIPDDDYPRDYQRPTNHNGQYANEFDYLDDYGTMYLPDGGRHFWDPLKPWSFSWGPWLPRTQSMKSDFLTDEPIKGLKILAQN